MELAGLKVMMAGHSSTRTKLVCRTLLSLMLWALDLQLWSGSLVGYLLGSSTDGHCNFEANNQVCRLAAWIS